MHTRPLALPKARRSTARITLIPLTAVAVALAAIGLVACGGSGPGDVVVAQVGGTPITRTAVSHWMATLAGSDYYELSRAQTLPAGLVSDPPDYSRCVASLQAAIPGAGGTGSGPDELLKKCREINVALRIQAVGLLVQAQWLTSVDRQEGMTVTEQEVQQLFKQIRAEQYPTEVDLRGYLSGRRWSLPDLLLTVRLDLLGRDAESKIAAGGKQAAEFADAEQQWAARTSCNAGYVVAHCKQFKGAEIYPDALSPSVLLEQVAALVTGRCINRQACGKETVHFTG